MKNNKNFNKEEWVKKPKIDTFKERFSIKQLFKKQKKRILAFLLALFTFGSTLTPVIPAYALDSISFDHGTYLNAYYDSGNFTDASGNVHNGHGQVAFMTMSDGTPVYCIQLHKGTTGCRLLIYREHC